MNKYIKLFENFKDIDFIDKEEIINNIFIELIDNGYTIDYDNIKDVIIKVALEPVSTYEFMLYIDKGGELFNSDIVEEYLLVFLDYMKSCYNVLSYKFATYRRSPTKTISGHNSFTTYTTYYDSFPNMEVETIGIDLIIK